ncbi:MAG: prolyl oligopeptidase family serine peptidase, partial [Acidobacteriota bacterium]
VAIFIAIPCFAQSGIDFAGLMRIKRVSDPRLSPDGKTVLYSVGIVNVDSNRTVSQIYSVSITGGESRQLTSGKSSSSPRWSPDGMRFAYLSEGQIWLMSAGGGGATKLTNISSGASNPAWSPDGRFIAFSSDVYPECQSDDCNRAEDERVQKNGVQAKTSERLLYRHWDEWRDRKRTHVFMVPAVGGAVVQITSGDFDSPPYAAATGVDFAFSPDSSEIAYIANFDKVEAQSTNSDIVIKNLIDGSTKNITVGNRGYDVGPVFSRDGRFIFYRSQKTPGFEADRWRIMRYERSSGLTIEITQGFDQQAEDIALSNDGSQVLFTAGTRGLNPIYAAPTNPNGSSSVKLVRDGGYFTNVNLGPDGRAVVFLASTMNSPAEVFYSPSVSGEAVNLSRANSALGLNRSESLEWVGAEGARVHGFLLKPGGFDPKKKYPLLVLIHGGPQGAWNDNWGYRWNPQIFANAGYVVFMPNPRGSTGYGQKFVDEISADWGGKVFTDIKNGIAKVLENPFVDKERIGAAGGSYGGYMVNWILGHNDDPRFKFKALISHAGVYNLESMATVTEELWFVDWEFKGVPWEKPEYFERWSPHKFAKNFGTPTLVIHGELDYRVPVDQGLQLFTTLQRRNVPSKLLYYPDEGHWILKPKNSELWYASVIDWLTKHVK